MFPKDILIGDSDVSGVALVVPKIVRLEGPIEFETNASHPMMGIRLTSIQAVHEFMTISGGSIIPSLMSAKWNHVRRWQRYIRICGVCPHRFRRQVSSLSAGRTVHSEFRQFSRAIHSIGRSRKAQCRSHKHQARFRWNTLAFCFGNQTTSEVGEFFQLGVSRHIGIVRSNDSGIGRFQIFAGLLEQVRDIRALLH
jgi:hypothetical protein